MEIGVAVGDIMTRNFVSIKPDSNLIQAARKMLKNRVGSLVVIENKQLRGIITERDIIWAIIKKNKKELSNIKVNAIAKKKVYTIKPSADLYKALKKMKSTGYRWLPVTKKKQVIGLLTIKDILRVEPSLFETAQEIMQIKENSRKLNQIKNSKITRSQTEGVCEECGNLDILYNIDNRFICESCMGTLT